MCDRCHIYPVFRPVIKRGESAGASTTVAGIRIGGLLVESWSEVDNVLVDPMPYSGNSQAAITGN
jgi:hypothetical protein